MYADWPGGCSTRYGRKRSPAVANGLDAELMHLKPPSAILGKVGEEAILASGRLIRLHGYTSLSGVIMRPLLSGRCALLFWSVLASLMLAARASAADKTAAELLPACVVVYVEVPQPGKALDTVLDHPLMAEVLKAPEYQRALETPQYQQFAAVVRRVEERLGMKWRDAIGGLTRGGLAGGFDLP